MCKKLIILSLVLFTSSAVIAEIPIESIKQCQSTQKTSPSFNEMIRTFHFEEARIFCDKDAQKNPKKSCQAISRYWLSVFEFANGNYAKSMEWLNEAKKFAEETKEKFFWGPVSAWTSEEDYFDNLKARSSMEQVSPEYKQKIQIIFLQNTDLTYQNKKYQYTYEPCTLPHMYLTFEILAKYIEVFSAGKYSLQFSHKILNTTLTKFQKKIRWPDLDSMEPWDEELSVEMADSIRNNDSIVYVYPNKSPTDAMAGGTYLPIIPKGFSGPIRNNIELPSGWVTFKNFPQVFHEFTHTVEYATGIKSTVHNKKEMDALIKLTGIMGGEGKWLQWQWANIIIPKVEKVALKSKVSGYMKLFGMSQTHPFLISDSSVKNYYKTQQSIGREQISKNKKEAAGKNKEAYALYNKGKHKEAAESSVQSVELYPWESSYLEHAEWFIEHSGLSEAKKQALKTRLTKLY